MFFPGEVKYSVVDGKNIVEENPNVQDNVTVKDKGGEYAAKVIMIGMLIFKHIPSRALGKEPCSSDGWVSILKFDLIW